MERLLWTGPCGAALQNYALAGALPGPTCLCVTHDRPARDQARRLLAMRGGPGGSAARAWTWGELWRAVRGESTSGPKCLSEAAADAVFGEAVREARLSGELDAVAAVADGAGYRRRLKKRLAAWTRGEHPLDNPPSGDAALAAEWSVFVRYRELLRRIDAEDAEGLAVWASRHLKSPPGLLGTIDQLVLLDWEGPTRAQWRALERFLDRARSVRVTMVREPSPSAEALFAATASAHRRLRALGFDEVPVTIGADRPAGLKAVELALFHQGAGYRDEGLVSRTEGLFIRGAPRGEGAARTIAREIRALLEAGAMPEDVLVLFPEWNDEADIALEVALDWGLPISAEPNRPLSSGPAVAALSRAIHLPIEEWATDHLILFLRNGRARLDGGLSTSGDAGGADIEALTRAAAAAVVQSSMVFRERGPLTDWLKAEIGRAEKDHQRARADRARSALAVVTAVFDLLAPLDQPRPFAEHLGQLIQIAAALQLDGADAPDWDRLRDAMEDHADIRGRPGQGQDHLSWPEFVAVVDSAVADLTLPVAPARPGTARMATVDEARGARARYVILADLAEGSFPSRDTVEGFLNLRPGEAPDPACLQAFSREMMRFSSVLGSAEAQVLLVYPTTDARGQEMLRSGFLDELMGLLTPEARAACHESFSRVGPALIDAPELAGSPRDRRVRALALARERGDLSALQALARGAPHSRALEGAAAALHTLDRRARGAPFGEFDGLLRDEQALVEIAAKFSADYSFSASQLETYISCPFHFFYRHVLKLTPNERRDEIDEDFTEQGTRIHDLLKQLEELRMSASPEADLSELARAAIKYSHDRALISPSSINLGISEIDDRRLEQTFGRYFVQSIAYQNGPWAHAGPYQFEVAFGEGDPSHPPLEIGQAPHSVRFRGKIDRIDLVDEGGRRPTAFRVIDYKSGTAPSLAGVREGRYVQLLLYAMAVERSELAADGRSLQDVGYWELREKGYRSIAFKDWRAARDELERYLIEVVDQLKSGRFVVDSLDQNCERFCDFRAVCRVRQARQASKPHERPVPPELFIEPTARRRN